MSTAVHPQKSNFHLMMFIVIGIITLAVAGYLIYELNHHSIDNLQLDVPATKHSMTHTLPQTTDQSIN